MIQSSYRFKMPATRGKYVHQFSSNSFWQTLLTFTTIYCFGFTVSVANGQLHAVVWKNTPIHARVQKRPLGWARAASVDIPKHMNSVLYVHIYI
jgi:hypothetical protein